MNDMINLKGSTTAKPVSSCNVCKKKDVCKYAEVVSGIEKQINHNLKEKALSSFITPVLKCKFFEETAGIRVR